MIDDKKIEKAARQISEKVVDAKGFDDSNPTHLAFAEGHVDGFNAGAKWAINEFLKNLWHPASEKPKRRCNYLLLHYKDKEEECCEADVVDTKAWDCYIKGSLAEYINIDDLFPKEGGEG